jgi:hypothetical protein
MPAKARRSAALLPSQALLQRFTKVLQETGGRPACQNKARKANEASHERFDDIRRGGEGAAPEARHPVRAGLARANTSRTTGTAPRALLSCRPRSLVAPKFSRTSREGQIVDSNEMRRARANAPWKAAVSLKLGNDASIRLTASSRTHSTSPEVALVAVAPNGESVRLRLRPEEVKALRSALRLTRRVMRRGGG